ncbi:MAG: major capsid protein [Halomonas sp.]|nr:major capsid protein [Halomonas sp.]
MSLVDMKVFNANLMEATAETLGQQVEKFNGASNGAIVLTSMNFEGDFFQRSFYAALHSAQRRVDRYAAQSSAAATALSQLQENSVKVAGGFGPISFEPGQMSWIQKNEAEAIAVISGQLAEAIIKDQLNSSVAAAVAAIANQGAATVNDVSASAAISYTALNTAHALFGDSSMDLVAQVMDGSTYHRLIGDNLANTPQLFQAQNVLVVDILGKPVIVTDAPALYEAGTPNKNKVLSLASSGVTVMDGSDVITNIDTSNGQSRIETTMQADYTFGLGVKGYAWDITNGGKSPSDAALATGTNWDLVASNIKHTAGVLTVGSADA